ncbi:hypothetical protein WISP_12368 [Willisornis vidua]|uniref:Uncharacterized protein n=1 Tax=Willisornis vidua TaxID=1566151 RepID=A0ABQ9DQW3_9PASS|nr:hypothetical protein WISP_12368 [Willisornis vidua]
MRLWVLNPTETQAWITYQGGSQCPELQDHDCENDQLPVNPDTVQDLLLQVGPYKSMGPDGIQKTVDVITNPLSMIFEQSWDPERSQVTGSWRMLS